MRKPASISGYIELLMTGRKQMRRCVCVFGLLVLLMTSAGAKETVLPGLIRAPMAIAIDLPDGRKVTLEGLVIRPDRPGASRWSF